MAGRNAARAWAAVTIRSGGVILATTARLRSTVTTSPPLATMSRISRALRANSVALTVGMAGTSPKCVTVRILCRVQTSRFFSRVLGSPISHRGNADQQLDERGARQEQGFDRLRTQIRL